MRLVLLLLVVVAACAGPGAAGAGVAGEWVLVDGAPVVERYPITLEIEDGEVGGVAACNRYGGRLRVTGDRFEVAEVMRTEIGCPEPGVHDSEAAYLDALQAVSHHERDGAQLVLTGPDVALRFDPVPPPEDAPLTGTRWELGSLLSGTGPEGTASSTLAEAHLVLADDGTLTASDGCNDLSGRWSLHGEVLVVEEVVTTDMACEGLEPQTEHVHEVLLGRPDIALDGQRLLLTAGGRGLELHPAGPG